jgi:transcription elongation factor Elf1
MAETPDESTEIKETDIVFDCPHCGKSLAIDYRGAGLTIPCTDCGKDVEVPIPVGMELNDIDSSDEEQEVRILNLRRSLAAAEDRIQQLEAVLHETTAGHANSVKERAADQERFRQILTFALELEAQLEGLSRTIKSIRDAARGEG